jgi:hypothetical protein
VRTDPGYSVRRSLSVEEGVGDRDRERASCSLRAGLNVSYRPAPRCSRRSAE